MKTPKSGAELSGLPEWRRLICDFFSEGDVRVMCFDLSVDFESLSGTSKDTKVVSLMNHMLRTQRLPDLAGYCFLVRPAADWRGILDRFIGESRNDAGRVSKQTIRLAYLRRLHEALARTRNADLAVRDYFSVIGHLDRYARRVAREEQAGNIDRSPLAHDRNYVARRMTGVMARVLGNFRYLRHLDAALVEFGFDAGEVRALQEQMIKVQQAMSDLGLYREYQKQLVQYYDEQKERGNFPTAPLEVSWGSLEPFAPLSFRMIEEFVVGSAKPMREREGIPHDINRYCPWHDMTILHMSDPAIQLTLSLFHFEPRVMGAYLWIADKCKEHGGAIPPGFSE